MASTDQKYEDYEEKSYMRVISQSTTKGEILKLLPKWVKTAKGQKPYKKDFLKS